MAVGLGSGESTALSAEEELLVLSLLELAELELEVAVELVPW
jgi:hypothetical protein